MNRPLTQTGLVLRTVNILEDQGFDTVEAVLRATRERLLSIENFGEKTIAELYKAIRDLGLEPPEEWKPPVRRSKKKKKRKT